MSNLLASLSYSCVSTFIMAALFETWLEKYLHAEIKVSDSPVVLWIVGLFIAEFLGDVGSDEILSSKEQVLIAFITGLVGAVIFLICYGVLSLIGTDKEDKIERSYKAFKGLVIIFWLLLILGLFMEDL